MSLFKKLTVFLLFFPLFFLLLSFLPQQKAQAAGTNLNVVVVNDANDNAKQDSSDPCFKNVIQLKKNTTTLAQYTNSASNCAKNYKFSEEQFNLALVKPTRDISYIHVVDGDGTKTWKANQLSGSNIGVKATSNGNAAVYYGLKKETNNNPPGNNNPPDNKKDCTNAPGLNIKPVQQVGKKGSTQEFSITVKNNDKANCDASDKFSLKIVGDIPANWTAKLADDELQIAGQKNKPTKLNVKSPQGAKEGEIKIFHVQVQRKTGGQKVTGLAKYKVQDSNDNGGGGGDGIQPSNPPDNNGECKRKIDLSATANKEWVKPGEQIVYTVKVKNEDTGKCTERDLNLQRLLPGDNWSGTWDPKNEFKLAKGVTKSFKLTVKSPQNAAKATKKIKINLRNKDNKVIATTEVDFVVSNVEPTPTPTEPIPTDQQMVNLNIIIGADGIGTTKRIPIGGNKNPDPDFANLDVFLYYAAVSDKLNNSLAYQTNLTFNYNPEIEKLEGTVTLPFDFPNGAYNLYATGPRYKISQLPGSITFSGTDKKIGNENFYLIAGDINKVAESNNNIDMNDYNVMLSCSIYSQDSGACDQDPNYQDYSDLNYDGIVNEDDFTLWLKEVGNQEGAPLPTPIDEDQPEPVPVEEE